MHAAAIQTWNGARQERRPVCGKNFMTIQLTRVEEFALITLNRPEALNALSGALLRDLVDRIPADWRSPAVAITIDVAPNVPTLHTDAGKVKTIVRNLLHNALKFTERGWVSITAGVSPRGDVLLTVRDTGAGIPREALAYIFDMFTQVPGSGGGGVGLGLHLVSRLVTALGGSVDVESTLERGTTFTVTFPRLDVPIETEPGVAAA